MIKALLIGLLATASLRAQSVDSLKLDHLKAKAKEHVDLTLDASTLGLAAGAMKLGSDDKTKAAMAGLKGIAIRSFEFNKEGEYSPADVEQMRRLFQGPGWKRTVGIVSKADRESFEIFVRNDAEKGAAMGMVVVEPRELVLIYFEGAVDLARLGELAARFGVSAVKKGKQ